MRYLTTTKNLFDKNNVVDGYIDEYGTLSKNDGWKASDFIPITSNTSYTISGISYAGYLAFHAWYDINKNFISSVSNKINSQTMVSPSGAAYIRVCCKQSVGDLDTLQLEEGSTATPYVPYGYLPMYKGRYKVSDVCQLLDKSTYPATKTSNGITWTNNGDGTITANGTATGGNAILNVQDSIAVIAGHKYLVSTDYTNQVRIQLYTTQPSIFGSYSTAIVPQIITCINNYNRVYYQIVFLNGVTVSDAMLKPQLFDLTEMYGAGNEPTTVAEFREKFPNELYPYSPYCWAKMKQMRYITTTKNLFDNIPVKTNYIINSNGEEVATPGYNIYGKMYGNNFTISTNAPVDLNGSDNWLRVCLYNSEGTFITRKDFAFNTRTVINIADDNIAYIQLCFHRASFPNYKLQVELGSTATPYVPYGYLPLK